MTEIVKAPLAQIKPNPYQVERPDNKDALLKLAGSIREKGMIDIPLARRVNGEIQLADGHRRNAAHWYLFEGEGLQQFGEMDLRIKELTDQDMADIVIHENMNREDLDPICEARFYKRYLTDFKVTQEKLAKRMGCSQSEIANKIRLLDLPEYIQASIIAQEISARHGRELLALKAMPKILEGVFKQARQDQSTVRQTKRLVASALTSHGRPLQKGAWYSGHRCAFDVTDCEKCKHRVQFESPYREDEVQIVCTDESCWDKKQDAAEEKTRIERQKEIDKMVADLASKSQLPQGPLDAEPDDTGKKKKKPTKLGKIATDKETAEKTKAIDTDKLKYGEYNQFYDSDKLDDPAQCKVCPKRVLGIAKYWDKPKLICLDPKCYSKKKGLHTRKANKEQKDLEKQRTQDIEAVFRAMFHAGINPINDKSVLIRLFIDVASCYQSSQVSRMMRDYGLPEFHTFPKKWDEIFKDKTDKDLAWIIVRELYLKLEEKEKLLLHCVLADMVDMPKPKHKCRTCGKEVVVDTGAFDYGYFRCAPCQEKMDEKIRERNKPRKETPEEATDDEIIREIPCLTCMNDQDNAGDCDRSHFHVEDDETFACLQRVPKEEVSEPAGV